MLCIILFDLWMDSDILCTDSGKERNDSDAKLFDQRRDEYRTEFYIHSTMGGEGCCHDNRDLRGSNDRFECVLCKGYSAWAIAGVSSHKRIHNLPCLLYWNSSCLLGVCGGNPFFLGADSGVMCGFGIYIWSAALGDGE